MNSRRFIIPAAALMLLLGTACKRNATTLPSEPLSDTREIPQLPDKPYDYPASSNDYLAAMGRTLFYDKELSANKNISCGSCHQQQHGFTDNLQFSPGTDNIHGKRNTPSIFNKTGRLFWDGRAGSMSDLALRPVKDPVEMNSPNINVVIDRIGSIDYYNNMIKYAFPKATHIDSNMIKTAIAEFLKNFNFSDTKFNRVKRGIDTFTPSEELGQDLFMGEAKCSSCHHIDGSFNNNSGYGHTDESHNIGLDLTNPDPGVGAISKNENENGTFMMPVLLNVEFTAPYMHDGRFKTLEEVVDHYDSKIKNNPSLDFRLRDWNNQPLRMNLTAAQKKGLVDFLKTLSDRSILTDEKFSDPFVPRSL